MSSVAVYTPRSRLSVVLWLAGMLGIVALVTTDLPQLPPNLLQGRELPIPMWAFLGIAIVQGALFVALAVWVGTSTAPALGMRAPTFEAAATGQQIIPHLVPQLRPGLVFGLLICLFLFAVTMYGPDAWVATQASYYPSLLVRVLYGGITEEVLLRWGLMNGVIWALWRIFQRRGGSPRAPAPAWELKDLNGKSVKSSDFQGKVIILTFCNMVRAVPRGNSWLDRAAKKVWRQRSPGDRRLG